MVERIELNRAHVVRLKRSARLRYDKARDIHTLLAPERVVVLNATSVMIIEALDGRDLDAILDDFAVRYDAPRELIAKDVITMLQDFADKGYLEVV